MSATMNANKFRAYFNNAPILVMPGRTHPVDVRHIVATPTAFGNEINDTVARYVLGAVKTVAHIAERSPPGDILVFMPGQEDIAMTIAGVKHETKGGVATFGLYADMPKARQLEALAPLTGDKQHLRKCIVATNIAETSLTIDGIVYIVVCENACLATVYY